MRSILLLVAALLLSPALSGALPSDSTDGLYAVEIENGQPITKRLEVSSERNATALSKRFAPLPSDAKGVCTGGSLPQDGTYEEAQACLGDLLNFYSGRYGNPLRMTYPSIYCRFGNAVLAMCNYGQDDLGDNTEVDAFNTIMDQTCGLFTNGYVFIQDWQKTYWRTTWGQPFCQNVGVSAMDVTNGYIFPG